MTKLNYIQRNLLWIDCTAGALVGIAVLSLSGWLSNFYSLPVGLLQIMGAAKLIYACYSFSLAVRARRPKPMIILLIFANLGWAVVCIRLAVTFAESATIFGMVQLVGEAFFVGGLAGLEWKWRERLLSAA